MNTCPYTVPPVGSYVRVHSPKYGGKCSGQTGTIRAVYADIHAAVDIDFMVNEKSQYGYFYFEVSELEVLELRIETPAEETNIEEKGEKTMHQLTNYVNVVEVQFLNDSTAFRTIECANYDPNLTVNQLCVVKTASHGLGLAEVVRIKDAPEKELRREIVAGVNTIDYDNRVMQRERAAELRAKMQERAAHLQDILLYQTLAKEDPEMAQLLQDFKALNV